VRVEFFGIPRERSGVAELELQAETLGQLLATLAVRFPSFGEVVQSGRLRSPFLANLNGERFVSDPATRLTDADSVLILSADAGG
jgi:molybdopterin converting factor small subunit